MTRGPEQDKDRELEHARKILHKPEFYWNEGTAAGKKGSLRRAEWVAAEAALGPGRRILEVGCGTGFFSDIFRKTGAEIYAIDLSPDLLDIARERIPRGVRFTECDIEALPFRDRFFDAAVGIRVLHHLNMDAAFHEITRTLKPGGRIAFCEPNMMNPQIMIQKNIPFVKRLMGDTPGETAFFKWGLRRFLAKKGFTRIRIEPFDFLHPWVPRPLVSFVDRAGAVCEKVPVLKEIAGSLRISAVYP